MANDDLRDRRSTAFRRMLDSMETISPAWMNQQMLDDNSSEAFIKQLTHKPILSGSNIVKSVKTDVNVHLKPFLVPDSVLFGFEPFGEDDQNITFGLHGITEQGESFMPTVPSCKLEEIDSTALKLLCDNFTDAVFKKAGKKQPEKYEIAK